jgi:hypothetical protein
MSFIKKREKMQRRSKVCSQNKGEAGAYSQAHKQNTPRYKKGPDSPHTRNNL